MACNSYAYPGAMGAGARVAALLAILGAGCGAGSSSTSAERVDSGEGADAGGAVDDAGGGGLDATHTPPASDATEEAGDAGGGLEGGEAGEAPATVPAPLVVPATGGSGAHLVTTASTDRLKLHGVVVWGIEDYVTTTFAVAEHANADAVAATIASWGGNVIRLRVLADEYINLKYMGTKTNYLQWIKDWVAAAEAHGLYVQLCWWDSLDSQNGKNDANWATQYSYAFSMMTDVHEALKLPGGADDPSVFYEPFNEPNNVSWAQWLPAMKATVAEFRTTAGYQGMLIIDTTTWSHDYSDTTMGELETYDATLTKSGKHNLAFARHDYCNDYTNDVFSGTTWIGATGGSETAHVMIETEFGNYDNPYESASWSAAATAYFKTDLFDRSNVGGAEAFLFGNWFDDNAMSSDAVGAMPTTWGNDVKNWLGAQ